MARNKSIPHIHLCEISKLTCGRLHDTSVHVKKAAVQLLKTLIEYNPFMGELNITKIKNSMIIKQGELRKLEVSLLIIFIIIIFNYNYFNAGSRSS